MRAPAYRFGLPIVFSSSPMAGKRDRNIMAKARASGIESAASATSNGLS